MRPVLQKWLCPGLLAISTFAGDYFSKNWANSCLQYGQARPFLPGLLQFNLTVNTGAAFGIGKGQGSLMTILALAIVVGIIIWVSRKEGSSTPPSVLERCGIGIIIGGALGNLFDRLVRHEVTDFLDFCFMSFPVFNLADALIDLGALLVVIGAFAGSTGEKTSVRGEPGE
jgi:signal peptidase II